MPSDGNARADRRRRLAGQVERIGVIDPRHQVAVAQMVGEVLADVERRHRQHRRQQDVVALEERPQLVAQRVALEHLAVVVAQAPAAAPARECRRPPDRSARACFRGTAAAGCPRRHRIPPTRYRPDRARTRARPDRPCSRAARTASPPHRRRAAPRRRAARSRASGCRRCAGPSRPACRPRAGRAPAPRPNRDRARRSRRTP